MKFIVIGDGLWDRYWCGTASRLSPECPIPVVSIESIQHQYGGVWNVVGNLKSLGIESFCPNYPLHVVEIEKDMYPIKNRLIANGIQIARWDERDFCPPINIDEVKKFKADRILIADYAKGAINPEVLLTLYEMNLPTFVDTKRDPTPYLGWTTTILPNIKEYTEFKNKYDLFERCVVTMGEHGASLLEFGKEIEHVEAFNLSPVCVSGAGDTFSAGFAIRWPRNDAMEFASLASAVVVGKPMTATCNIKELNEFRKTVRRNRKKSH